MQTILLTGAAGYLGRHLLASLSHQSASLHGSYRTRPPLSRENQPSWHQLDLRNAPATTALIKHIQPTHIYHLAGNIRSGRLLQDGIDTTWLDNLHATLHLYDACLQLPYRPRILFVSSGAIYGQQPGLITEHTPLAPLSPYAASKAAADLASFQYSHGQSLPIIRARLFNYLGPGLSSETALGRFVHELVRLERSNTQPAVLTVGSLAAERDFLHISDVVSALTLLMEQGEPGEACNIASGTSRTMRWYLNQLLACCRIPITVEERPLNRAEAVTLQVSNARLQQLGWKPRMPIEQGLKEMMEYARAQTETAG